MEPIMRITRSFVSRAALGATLVVGLVAVTAATKSTPYGAALFGADRLTRLDMLQPP